MEVRSGSGVVTKVAATDQWASNSDGNTNTYNFSMAKSAVHFCTDFIFSAASKCARLSRVRNWFRVSATYMRIH